jgi:lysophospholipase L1-like esterase
MHLRRRAIATISALILSSALCLSARAQDDPAALRLTLPPAMYAVVGQPTSIYLDDVVLTQTPEQYRLEVLPSLGSADATHWSFTPDKAQVGRHTLRLQVKNVDGRLLGHGSMQLQVVSADAGAGRKLTLLLVGDSLTHASVYPNELARLFSTPGNPACKMLGTHHPETVVAGVGHEGYGGWTWARFASHWNPGGEQSHKTRSSPFLFAGADGKGTLDVGKYFDTQCQGERPDIVTFLLGINDCFGANPDNPQAMDGTIDSMLTNADVLLAAFHQAAPHAELAVCLTVPPNSREAAFLGNYNGKRHRWGWKRIQHRLVERELAHFGGREKEGIFLVPAELGVDPVGDYPVNNAVHPNAAGYRQIAATLYAWIKWRLATRPAP